MVFGLLVVLSLVTALLFNYFITKLKEVSLNNCDVIKQNQSKVRNIDFKDRVKQSRNCLLFPLFLAPFNCSYLWNQMTNFNRVFLQNVAVKMVNTVRKMKTEFDQLQTDFA